MSIRIQRLVRKDRRRVLKLVAGIALASALPPIRFPLAPHARAPGDAALPSGLGLGINLDEPGQGERMLDTALEVFDPAWYYTWWRDPVRNRPGWLPMIWTHGWNGTPVYPVDAEEFSRYSRTLRQSGIDPGRLVWMLANEPEFSGWTPKQSIDAIMTQVDVMRRITAQEIAVLQGAMQTIISTMQVIEIRAPGMFGISVPS